MSSSTAKNESAAQRPSGIVPSGSALAAETAPRRGERPCINVADVDYLALSPRGAPHPALAAVYATWRDGWRAVLRELGVSKEVRSNDFTQQEVFGVLFIRGACAAVTAMRFCDLSQPMWQEDSYFESWPKVALARLGQSRVCISSNTLIAPEWRGARLSPAPVSAVGRASAAVFAAGASPTAGRPASSDSSASEPAGAASSIKSVVSGLIIQQFLASQAELMVGVARNDRSMDRMAREHGCERIGTLDIYGIESDIVLFERAGVPPPHPLVEELWSRQSSDSWFSALAG